MGVTGVRGHRAPGQDFELGRDAGEVKHSVVDKHLLDAAFVQRKDKKVIASLVQSSE